MIKLLAASAVMALAFSACSGSGSSPLPAGRGETKLAAPAASTVPASGGGGSAASAQRSTMSISIKIPPKKKSSSGKRGTKTVSPGTAYVDVVLKSHNGMSQPVDGPYTVLVPVSQLGDCNTSGGGRSHGRATQSVSGCFTVSVPAPVGNVVYAVAALDSNMTMLDFADNLPVTVTSSGTATLAATLNGVGASVLDYTMLTDPMHTTQYNIAHNVDCSAYAVHYDRKAVCSILFDVADASGDDMAAGFGSGNSAFLGNVLSFTVTDLTTQTMLNIGYDATMPDPSAPVHQIVFDPASQGGGLSGTTLYAPPLTGYSAVLHPDFSEIPDGATDTIEVQATLSPPATYSFGQSVLFPVSAPTTYTFDLQCRNVTVGAGDPSGVPEGAVLNFCEQPESNLNLVVQ
jgi:hypothetical protein